MRKSFRAQRRAGAAAHGSKRHWRPLVCSVRQGSGLLGRIYLPAVTNLPRQTYPGSHQVGESSPWHHLLTGRHGVRPPHAPFPVASLGCQPPILCRAHSCGSHLAVWCRCFASIQCMPWLQVQPGGCGAKWWILRHGLHQPARPGAEASPSECIRSYVHRHFSSYRNAFLCVRRLAGFGDA